MQQKMIKIVPDEREPFRLPIKQDIETLQRLLTGAKSKYKTNSVKLLDPKDDPNHFRQGFGRIFRFYYEIMTYNDVINLTTALHGPKC